MIDVPTCRNPDCPEAGIPKPYFPPPEAFSSFVIPPLSDGPPPADNPSPPEADLQAVVEWFCGACGSSCEIVQADEAEFTNPFEIAP